MGEQPQEPPSIFIEAGRKRLSSCSITLDMLRIKHSPKKSANFTGFVNVFLGETRNIARFLLHTYIIRYTSLPLTALLTHNKTAISLDGGRR